MEKVIRDGKVAVIYSPGFGAGWYSWNEDKQLLFHPKLVDIIENGDKKLICTDWVKDNLGIEDVYCGGAHSLRIEWLDEGSVFKVDEYDGSESISVVGDPDYLTA